MRLFSRRRSPAAPAATRKCTLSVHPLESRITPTLTLHPFGPNPLAPKGTFLTHADAQNVFMGAGWSGSADGVSDINHFEAYTKFIVSKKADYLPMLGRAKYGVGAGKAEAGVVDTSVSTAGGVISDATIRAELQAQITAGNVQQPNKNRIYMVFVAPGVEVTTTFGDSQNNFCAYHNAFSGTDANGKAWPIIAYAVMPYQGTGVNAQNPDVATGLTLSHFDAITVAASHELAEAVTDTVPGDGWYDIQNNGEIGDLINAQDCVIGGFVVQKEVTKDVQPLLPKGAVPYAYFSGIVGAGTVGLVSAFVPTTNDDNTNFGVPTGINHLVPGAVQNQSQATFDPSVLYAGTSSL
jgi:hypothetical protein